MTLQVVLFLFGLIVGSFFSFLIIGRLTLGKIDEMERELELRENGDWHVD